MAPGLLQALELPTPVQWIGWWLTTPLEHCLAWNQQQPRQVEERVIRQMVSVLPTSVYEPAAAQQKKLPTDPGQRREMLQRWQERFLDRQRSLFREEGFAAVVAIDPSAITTSLSSAIQDITSGLDFQIQMAIHRTAKIEVHGYSRLLDLERLIFLIRLLLESPGVELADPLVERELRASFRFEPNAPLPDEPVLSFATRAANALRRRHGSPFGEESDVVVDLNWLKLKKQEWQKQRQHADDLSSPHPWLAQDGSIQGTGLNPWICSTHVFTNCSLTNQRNPSTMSLLRHCQRK